MGGRASLGLVFSVAEIVNSTKDIDFQYVFQKISEENFQGLPQGGGIFSK